MRNSGEEKRIGGGRAEEKGQIRDEGGAIIRRMEAIQERWRERYAKRASDL